MKMTTARREFSKLVIRDLCRQFGVSIRNVGFRKALLAEFEQDESSEMPETVQRFHRVPDGYWVNSASKAVVVVEVEDTHPLSSTKLAEYADFSWSFDSPWLFFLVVADRSGNWDIMDLGKVYYLFEARRSGVDPTAWINRDFYDLTMGVELRREFRDRVLAQGTEARAKFRIKAKCPPVRANAGD